jgi:hypothetical protein
MGVDRVCLLIWSQPVKDMTATERIDEIGVSRGGQKRMYLVNLDFPKSSVDGYRYEYQVLQFCRTQLGQSEHQ